MRAGEPVQKPLVFFWENIGPTHDDRLRALAEAGYRVEGVQIAGRSAHYDWDSPAAAGYSVATLSDGERPATGLALAYRLLRCCLRSRARDIFLCHYEMAPVFAAACALRLAGRRVYTMVDSKFDDRPRKALREALKSLFVAPYSGALTASHRSREYLAFLGVRRERIRLGYDTLSVDRISSLMRSSAPGEVPFRDRAFVCVARLVAKKNLQATLRAFAAWLAQTASPRDLHLCGSGPLEGELRRLADELGIGPRVHFHGFIQSPDVARILARGLCLLLTSVEEQFGLVVIEAQAAGLPVIVSRNAGASDILISDGVNGFTINPHDVESCAALMLLLSEDEQRWRRFSNAARVSASAGDCRHFVAAVEAMIGSADARDGN